MNITRNKFVAIAYTLRDEKGEIIDSSDEKEPLEYIHGNGYLINGLENELENKEEGSEFSVKILPKDGYGEIDENLIFDVDRSHFPPEVEITEGMQFEAENGQLVCVKSVTDKKITVDANHAMAGKILNFDIKVLTVRDATEEDLMALTGMEPNCGCDCDCDCSSGCSCGGSCGCN
ncbi:MAG: FKBP-type peptidyl-prolyl cis-trans isomerase [Treponemataceae bacterium]